MLKCQQSWAWQFSCSFELSIKQVFITSGPVKNSQQIARQSKRFTYMMFLVEPTWVQIRKFYLRKILIIFLPIYLNMCFVCSKEPSHWDGSFEYPQHMFWMRNKENNFPIRTLIWRPGQYHNVLHIIWRCPLEIKTDQNSLPLKIGRAFISQIS